MNRKQKQACSLLNWLPGAPVEPPERQIADVTFNGLEHLLVPAFSKVKPVHKIRFIQVVPQICERHFALRTDFYQSVGVALRVGRSSTLSLIVYGRRRDKHQQILAQLQAAVDDRVHVLGVAFGGNKLKVLDVHNCVVCAQAQSDQIDCFGQLALEHWRVVVMKEHIGVET